MRGSADTHCDHWVCRWLALELGGHLADEGFMEMISEFAGYDLVVVFPFWQKGTARLWEK